MNAAMTCRSMASESPLPRRCVFSLFAFALVVLAGCASPPRGGGDTEAAKDLVCNSAQQCRVKVEVTCVQGSCRASVDHPRVFARGNDIVWIVDNKPGQSYVFAADGIAFKTEAGRNVFRCHPEANGNRFACMNNRSSGEYEYAVRLSGSPPVPVLDPWIVN
jgi:hypothetical protein